MSGYRVGIIGCGRIASQYENDSKARRYYSYLTHAGAYSSHPRTEIVAACDTDSVRLQEFGTTWGVTALYQDYKAMLEREDIQILSICTPVKGRLEIIQNAAAHVSLILAEKPLGINVEEIKKINRICIDDNCHLSVNLYRLFDPSHRQIGEMIREGKLGTIQRVNAFYGKGLLNQGSHLVSLLLSYFDAVEQVTTLNNSTMKSFPEPTYDFYATLSEGIPCSALACDFDNYRIFEVDILGESGRIVISDEGLTIRSYKVCNNRAESGAKELRETRRSPVRSSVGEALYWAVDSLVGVMDGTGEVLSSGIEYLATQKVLTAVERSWSLGGQSVRIGQYED